MTLGLALNVFLIVATALFWLHCARPVLTARGASPLAHGVVLGITVLMIAAYGLAAAAEVVAQVDTVSVWAIGTVIWFVWLLVVGLGYLQGYGVLLRVTGLGRPEA